MFNGFREKFNTSIGMLSKFRFSESTGSPLMVLRDIYFNGIDLFEAKYPF